MDFIAVVKRVVPFLLTFVAGLAIASIFVTVAAPSLSLSSKRMNRGHHRCKNLSSELENLRDENLRLRMQVEELRFRTGNDLSAPGPEFEVPAPPAPPIAPRAHRVH